MAFPVVEGTATSAQSTNSDPNGISLPAGVQAGDLLLVIYEVSNPVSITFPAGWTVFFTQVGGSFGGVLCNQVLAYKKAVGGETSINVSPGGGRGYAANAYRISGAVNPAVQPPQAVGTGGEDALPPTGSSDPPPLSPAGGSKDYLWITGYASSASNSTVPPANYGNQISIATAGGGRCNSARRELAAATEDPGPWVVHAGSYTVTTIAVHPGLPGGVAALSGTVTDDTESDIRAGGSTIVLTLLGAAWVAAGAAFDAERQGIIDGLVSAQSETTGWNAVLRPAIPVANVVRTSDTVVTITLPAEPAYVILADEVITAAIPASATDDGVPIVAEPDFTITRQPPPFFPQVEALSQGSGNTSTQIITLPTPVAADDLLLAFIAMGTANPANFPPPWVVIGDDGVTGAPGAVHLTVAHLKASGGESTVTFTGAQQTVWIVYRITGYRDPDLQPPEVVFQTSTGVAPLDPPLLAPAAGIKEYLWLTGGATKAFCNQIGSPPAGYGGAYDCESLSNDMLAFVGRRELIAASDDPGEFDFIATPYGVSFTLALPGVQAEGQPAAISDQVQMQQKLLLLL
jgi:hypothetical protein